jgi:hypothetical protein
MELNNTVLLALVAGFVSGVFGADSIGLWLVRIGTLIRRRGK